MHVCEVYKRISEIEKKNSTLSRSFFKLFLDSIKTYFPHLYRNILLNIDMKYDSGTILINSVYTRATQL